jgi:hypothetical protein
MPVNEFVCLKEGKFFPCRCKVREQAREARCAQRKVNGSSVLLTAGNLNPMLIGDASTDTVKLLRG